MFILLVLLFFGIIYIFNMTSTKRIKNKIKKDLPRLIRKAKIKGNSYEEKFWVEDLEWQKKKLEIIAKNKRKNLKQLKKSRGY